MLSTEQCTSLDTHGGGTASVGHLEVASSNGGGGGHRALGAGAAAFVVSSGPIKKSPLSKLKTSLFKLSVIPISFPQNPRRSGTGGVGQGPPHATLGCFGSDMALV